MFKNSISDSYFQTLRDFFLEIKNTNPTALIIGLVSTFVLVVNNEYIKVLNLKGKLTLSKFLQSSLHSISPVWPRDAAFPYQSN